MNGLEESTTPTRSHVRVVIMVVPHTACCARAAAVGAWGKYRAVNRGAGTGQHTRHYRSKNFNVIQGICNLQGRNNYTGTCTTSTNRRHVTRGGAVRRYRDVKHMLRMENKVSKCSKTGRNGPPL